jgi:hypothetical protein
MLMGRTVAQHVEQAGFVELSDALLMHNSLAYRAQCKSRMPVYRLEPASLATRTSEKLNIFFAKLEVRDSMATQRAA